MVDDSVKLGIDAGPAEAGARRFTAALSTINAGVMNLGRRSAGAFKSLSASIAAGATSFNQLKSAQQGVNFNSTNRSVLGLAGGMRGLENAMSGTFQAASVLRVALGALTVGTLVRGVFQATVELQRFMTTMQAATGSVMASGDAMRYTQDLALRLGQDMAIVQREFAQFAVAAQISGMTMTTTQKIFESVSTAMTVMGRSAQDSQLAFLALQQMISKGTVMSEELRRQLGERMPGAVQMMAQAVGVSTAELGKMMKMGQVISKDVLPAFADIVQRRFGPQLEDAMKRADTQIRALGSTITMIQQDIGQGGFMEALAQGARDLRDILSSPEFTDIADRLALGLADATMMAVEATKFLVENMDLFISAAKIIMTLGLAAMFAKVASAVGLMVTSLAVGAYQGLMALIASFRLAIVGGSAMTATLTGTSRAANIATFSVTTFGVAVRTLLGPLGIVLSLLGAAAWYFWPDTIGDAEQEVEVLARTLDRFAGNTDAAKKAVAELNDNLIGTRVAGAEELFARQAEKVAQLRGEFATAENSLVGFMSGVSRIFSSDQDALLNMVQKVKNEFVTSKISVEEFNSRLMALRSGGTLVVQDLIDTLIAGATAIGEATDKAEYYGSALRNLQFDQMRRETAAFNEQVKAQIALYEQLEATSFSLADAASTAGGTIAEMEQEIARGGMSDYARELAEVQDETAGVKKNLEETIQVLAQNQRFLTDQQLIDLKGAQGALARIKELEPALAKLRIQDKLTKDMEKLEKSAQKILDRLFPLQAASRSYNEDLDTLSKAYKAGKITQDQYTQGMAKLKTELQDTTDPLSANVKALEEERAVLQRALDIKERYAHLTGEQAMRVAELEGAGRRATDEQVAQNVKLIESTDNMQEALNGREATGIRKMVDDIKPLNEALAEMEATIAGNLVDAMAEFASTGKLNIQDLMQTMLLEMNKVAASQVFKQIFNMFASQTGGASGFSSEGGSFIASGLSFFGSTGSFAKGGISGSPPERVLAPASAFVGAPQFEKGGLTSGGMPAILHPNEAVVPLSGNRAIPVDIRNGGGQGMNIVNQFNFPVGTDVDSFRRSQGQIGSDVSQSMRRAARRNG